MKPLCISIIFLFILNIKSTEVNKIRSQRDQTSEDHVIRVREGGTVGQDGVDRMLEPPR